MPALAKINGEPIAMATAVRLSLLHDNTFLRDALRNVAIRQYAERHDIRNTDAELQLAADELRYGRGLEAVDAVQEWMRQNHQTPLALQEGIDFMLLNNKVRNSIPDDQIAAYYAEHAIDFEVAELYSIRVDSEAKAKELLAQMNDEEANFHVLAMEHSQDEQSRHLGGFVGRLARKDMTGVVAAAVFSSRPVSVIGPVKTDHGWNLFKVTKITRRPLDEVKGSIRLTLMQQLVDKLLADATVEYDVFDDEAAAV
jgi:parvulin-like peptidyl-prolyl isomerase